MNLIDYLSPDDIKSSYDRLANLIKQKQAFDEKLLATENLLEQAKAPIVADPNFKAAKNQALEESNWRARFPEIWIDIDDAKKEIKQLTTNITILHETINEYRMFIDYFSVYNSVKQL
jgi:hypothetical protein